MSSGGRHADDPAPLAWVAWWPVLALALAALSVAVLAGLAVAVWANGAR